MKPLVAIVGRPNVGKSMLFNKLIGQRLSIVEDTPGVTRDRIYGESEWCGRKFRLVDTGGIEPRTDDQILSFMREQAEIAIQHADVIIFLTDVKTGLRLPIRRSRICCCDPTSPSGWRSTRWTRPDGSTPIFMSSTI